MLDTRVTLYSMTSFDTSTRITSSSPTNLVSFFSIFFFLFSRFSLSSVVFSVEMDGFLRFSTEGEAQKEEVDQPEHSNGSSVSHAVVSEEKNHNQTTPSSASVAESAPKQAEPVAPVVTPTPPVVEQPKPKVEDKVSTPNPVENKPQNQPTKEENKAQTTAPAPATPSNANEVKVAAPAPSKKPSTWAAVVKPSSSSNDAEDQKNSTNAAPVSSSTVAQPQQPASPATVAATTNQVQKTQQKESKPTALFISNIPFESTESEVAEAFSQFGQIKHVDHRATKGFCFIDFGDANAVISALNHHKEKPIVLGGRSLGVDERKPKADAPRKMMVGGDKKDGKDFKKVPGGKPYNNNKEGERGPNSFQNPKKVVPQQNNNNVNPASSPSTKPQQNNNGGNAAQQTSAGAPQKRENNKAPGSKPNSKAAN